MKYDKGKKQNVKPFFYTQLLYFLINLILFNFHLAEHYNILALCGVEEVKMSKNKNNNYYYYDENPACLH